MKRRTSSRHSRGRGGNPLKWTPASAGVKTPSADFEIIAHRGASGYAPESTMAAFSKALLMGVRSIEFDVQETKDHQLVVIHDPDLKRVAGDRRKLSQLNFNDLSNLDVGSWFGPGFQGERVLSLEQLLDFLSGASRSIEIQLEIKSDSAHFPGIERRVLETLRHRPEWNGRVVISSFNHEALRQVRQFAPELRLGYLVGRGGRSAAVKEATQLACESIHLSLRRASRDWAEAAHAAGMRLLVYTVNSRKDLDRVQKVGADGAFSDFPDVESRPGMPENRSDSHSGASRNPGRRW